MHPIERLRKARGMTQGDLAREMGVALSTVQQWEKGAEPRPRILPKLADILKITPEELVDLIAGWQRSATA